MQKDMVFETKSGSMYEEECRCIFDPWYACIKPSVIGLVSCGGSTSARHQETVRELRLSAASVAVTSMLDKFITTA